MTVAILIPTTPTSLGPFYRPNAPFRDSLAENVDGERLAVSGRVVGRPHRTPLAAILDVWQADSEGLYDLQRSVADRAAYRLRGRIKTGTDGSFRFTTIRPSPYPVPGGVRPAHIHFLISSEGHLSLVSEIFFKGDPHLMDDPADHVRPDLVHALIPAADHCKLEIEFELAQA